MLLKIFNGIIWRIVKFIKSKILFFKIKNGKIENLNLHFGCGGQHLKNYINVDYKFSKSGDLFLDLSKPKLFPKNSINHVFSNAFFEHIFKSQRVDHLKLLFQRLNKDGFICYIGIPYFKEIAKLYLEGNPFMTIEHTFQFTHGGDGIANMNPYSTKSLFIADLHKSLYDEESINYCIKEAGFTYYQIFKYCHPHEEGFPVNIGFFALKSKMNDDAIKIKCLDYLRIFNNEKIIIDSIEFL